MLQVLIVCCTHCLLQVLYTLLTPLSTPKLQHTTYHTCSSHFTLPAALNVPTSGSQHTAQAAHSPPPLLLPIPPGLPFTAPATELKDHTQCAPFHPHPGLPSTSR